MEFEIEKKDDLKKVIKCIKDSKKNIILLSGTLGSGKTTLVKEFLKSEGIRDIATSPTFSIQNIYENKIFHYDVYQKKDEFITLGMMEELEKEGIHFIEWGEEIEDVLQRFGFDYLKINIELKNSHRIIKCQY